MITRTFDSEAIIQSKIVDNFLIVEVIKEKHINVTITNMENNTSLFFSKKAGEDIGDYI